MKFELKEGEDSKMLWRLAKVCMYLRKGAQKSDDKELEKKLCLEALNYCEKACNLEPNNLECDKWYCAATAKMASIAGQKNEKIKYGQDFKVHADIAIKLNPNDFLMQFMYGRYCYELSSLSWIERKCAQTIYGSIPESSFEEALNAFQNSDKLKPKWKDNYLWIAKTFIALNKINEAKQWIDWGLALNIDNIVDELAHNQLNCLKSKFK